MAIVVTLDVQMAKRKIRLNELARLVGITEQNLSVLKTGKGRAIRFSTLNHLCRHLGCGPGDLLSYEPDADPLSAEAEPSDASENQEGSAP